MHDAFALIYTIIILKTYPIHHREICQKTPNTRHKPPFHQSPLSSCQRQHETKMALNSPALRPCLRAFSVAKRLTSTEPSRKIFIAGGSDIYKQFLPYTKTLYKTVIDINVGGDKYFYANDTEWRITDLQQFGTNCNYFEYTLLRQPPGRSIRRIN